MRPTLLWVLYQPLAKAKPRHITVIVFTATADPVSVPPGSSGRSDWCNEHNTIHRHLDAIEEQVEKTVEYLESEVKTLLKDISEMAWSAPIALGTPLVDIFDGLYLLGIVCSKVSNNFCYATPKDLIFSPHI
uniref:Uncharacterized protein n=1 Tax=Chelonoidis abingdonii TaxID=106734 RepID=A0A8C0G9V9_CHEAB